MGLGAIVVVGAADPEILSSSVLQASGQESLLAEPPACIDAMGRPMMERTIERFVRVGVEAISVLVPAQIAYAVQAFPAAFKNVELQVVADVSLAIAQKFKEYSHSGIEHSFVVPASLYTETDLLDFFYFHREGKQAATRAFDAGGSLDLWVVDCAKAKDCELDILLRRESSGSSYFIREYVNRVTDVRDLRRYVSDVLRGRCAIRPSGVEIKPGIWVEDGAELHRRARIVAPAYIGRGTEIREDTLITRCSSVEEGCYIDYGTVIEDSSILANTHIGIWLDVCHSVAKGNKLFNLERNVILEISDESIMRATSLAGAEVRNISRASHQSQPMFADLGQKEAPTPERPERWTLGANPVEG